MQGQFFFIMAACSGCNYKEIENCRDGVIVLEIASSDRKWRYDCMLLREGVPVVALEVVKTHFSSAKKINQTRKNGVEIAEFRSEDIMDMQPGGMLKNLRIRVMVCRACTRKIDRKWVAQCWYDEISELIALDHQIFHEYNKRWNAMIEAMEIQAADAAERLWMEEQAFQQEKKALMDWMKACWELEIKQMGEIDADWADNYAQECCLKAQAERAARWAWERESARNRQRTRKQNLKAKNYVISRERMEFSEKRNKEIDNERNRLLVDRVLY
jgi:hypothetical protein